MNLIVILILFFILELISYYSLSKDAESYIKPYNDSAKKACDTLLTQAYGPVKVFQAKNFTFRPDNIGDENKQPILFFGCSYMYGLNLEDTQTLSYFVNKATNITTINRGVPGGSILDTLRDLNDNNLYTMLSKYKTPQYIVYLHIDDLI